MQISVDTVLPFTRKLVYEAYRDRLLETQPYLPNVQCLTLKTQMDTQSHSYRTYEWQGGGDVPALIRGYLSANLFTWTETNDWHNILFHVRWKIVPQAFQSAIICEGKNEFIDQGQETLVRTRGELNIRPEKLESVPRPMQAMVAKVAENILGDAITPNLEKMGQAIESLLSA